MERQQLGDRNAPAYPARQLRYGMKAKIIKFGNVPVDGTERELALVVPGLQAKGIYKSAKSGSRSDTWDGNWRGLVGVYEFKPTLDTSIIFRSLRITDMGAQHDHRAIITEIGVLASSLSSWALRFWCAFRYPAAIYCSI